MDEKKEVNEEPEKPAENTGEGDKPKTTTLVDEANSAAKRLEEANKRKAELLRQEEELEARRALGGRSEAGGEATKKEETPKEYMNKVMSGN